MRFYGKYIKPYLLFFIIGPILMLTEVLGEVLMPKMMANIINIGIPERITGSLSGWVLPWRGSR